MAPRFPTRLLLRHVLRRQNQSPPVPSRHHSTAALIPKPHPFTQPLFNPHGSPTIFNHPQHPILRFQSTRPGRSTRSKKPDIAARARQLQTRRLWTYALTISCIAGFIVIVLNQFQDQLVFYVTPTEALDKYTSDPKKSKFRLGGLVLENSVAQIPSSPEIQFVITDLITDILVKYEGSLPDLFREGHSAVVEGFIKPLDEETKKKEEALLKSTSKLGVTEKARTLECYFAATEVLAKHDEKYMPAEVANAIEKNKKFIEGQEKNGKEASINASAGAGDVKA
ncbi:cytochrome c-type biogenesis protein CcmE homolog, mitochondrial-like [Salvia miltiorrhiza]|uniref:cytochrome c-type biogenesis protein CcmE homolog, mitochondrial-like n=1 Tax=Salvia miltiorrhiza TaxID=226208 RepID=UPI0025ABE1AF|nr:cytochrome c-type biogenesis protein CcmE homolog, mitochondrial-like [Salvia miltiorrhiza]XP_057807695.1 cytochrome c-type biogenesis protein CcmE homolog, mitochondrial-like [Salvia miltiorrhiza]